MQTYRRFEVVTITFTAACFLLFCAAGAHAQIGYRAHDEERLRPTRQAALQADRTRIPGLIAILQEKPTPTRFLAETTLLSVAQLGATDALPAINALIQSGNDKNGRAIVEPNVVHAAIAARARLIAEADDSPDTGAPAQAQAKLNRFYTVLEETPTQINAGLLAYSSAAAKPTGADVGPQYPVELYAVRMLADMAYRSAFKGFVSLPGMTSINFDLDPRSALKVRLAPLSEAERAKWLVQDLSHKTVTADTEEAEIQLASELGTVGSAAAAVQLQEMDQNPTHYGRAAFNALFGVLSASGGPERALLKHFEQNPDPFIAEYARNGGTSDFIAGY